MESQSRPEHDVIFQNIHFIVKYGSKKRLKEVLKHLSVEALEQKDDVGLSALLHSAVSGSLECMSILLKAGACINSTDNLGRTALQLAINNNSYDCVKLLLSKGARWSQKDQEGATALHYAASVRPIKYLLAVLNKVKSGEIDVQDGNKQTALHWAATYGFPEHLRLLIKKGANVCIPDKDRKSPLHWAAHSSSSDCSECLKIIIEKFPDTINWQDTEGRSALHLAVLSGSIRAVDFLTSIKDCDMELLDNQFSTPMHYAAREGATDKLALLLGKGAAYQTVGISGATAMHYAACGNKVDAIKLFLSCAYVEDVPDKYGRNALMWAAATEANEVIQAMSVHTDFSYKDRSGFTALHIAAYEGLVTTVELLLTLGAPVDATDKNGSTPLLIACDIGNVAVIKVLLDHGASPLTTDLNKRNSLHRATRASIAYMVEFLLHLKPELDVKDGLGKVPLHYASENGSVNCVSVLVESCSNPNIADDQGKTALHYAALNNHYDVVRILLRHGAFINPMAICMKTGVTPTDCAVRCGNHVLIQYLQNAGGLTFSEIRTIAAKRIQTWFRKILFERRKSSNNAVWCEYHTVYHTVYGKTGDITKCGKIFCEEIQNFKNLHNSDPCVYYQSSSKSCILKHFRSSILDKCNLDEIEVDSDFQKSVNMCISDKCLAEERVVILQNSWEKFLLEREMDSVQQKINAAFPTIAHRKAAERKWLRELEKFLDSL